jgi:predicted  nucleic acid-binding Zn-ribbon protein
MHPDLVKLLELQAKDVALLDADRRLDAILAEVEALDLELADQERAVAQAREAVAEAGRRRLEIEGKIENYKKLEERGRLRLEQVRTQKEMQAVNTELDLARSVLGKEEADWLKLADVLAGLEATGKAAEKKLEQMRESQQTARGEIDLRRADAERVRTEALASRDAAAQDVNRALRTRYERLRSVKSVSVVVALSGAACGACFTTVPLNRRSQIRAGTLIDSCESCGVILYADDSGE